MKIHRKDGRGKSYVLFLVNNETFCLPTKKQKTKYLKEIRFCILWRTKMVRKSKKSLKKIFSISMDQKREKEKVKPMWRMPENSNSDVCVFFN